jgi:hypothetical protein
VQKHIDFAGGHMIVWNTSVNHMRKNSARIAVIRYLQRHPKSSTPRFMPSVFGRISPRSPVHISRGVSLWGPRHAITATQSTELSHTRTTRLPSYNDEHVHAVQRSNHLLPLKLSLIFEGSLPSTIDPVHLPVSRSSLNIARTTSSTNSCNTTTSVLSY